MRQCGQCRASEWYEFSYKLTPFVEE
jgi:hypothetical protein